MLSSGTPNQNYYQADPQTRLELNLGIIAASIATLRPPFAGLEQSMVLLPSDSALQVRSIACGAYKGCQETDGHLPERDDLH